ncbi:replication initiator [Microbacterium sp. NPDC096154]|uniref:replication initiator n=1 Tax=Microbacterium sp. NPDC096154 TaxID=3155549 RepID=UPI0033199F52
MWSTSDEFDPQRAEVMARGCARPIKTASGVWVRCGSRIKSRCESCAELYRGDWAAIARSGIFDGPVESHRFYLLTLTAPSFGRVHRVPRDEGAKASRCGCGVVHRAKDGGLRGVPLDGATYDYAGQVAWNRDAGVLWDRTRRRLRDRWESVEFFIVREWQERGVLHMHVLLRLERAGAPDADTIRDGARSAVAFSKIDGAVVEWGEQADCQAFTADGNGAKTIWYLSKALNYVLKDVVPDGERAHPMVWAHQAALARAARAMRCSRECVPGDCRKAIHARFGSRSHVVSASRRTPHRPGWSFTGLTRSVQRRLRAEWVARQSEASAPASSAVASPALVAPVLERLADRTRRESRLNAAAAP